MKASASGNDFLIVEGDYSASDVMGLSRRMCDRRNGIGADGVEWLSASPVAEVAAELINSDGSRAEISGNGTRCVAAYLCEQKKTSGSFAPRVRIQTGAGIKICHLISHRDHGYEFETDMGKPVVEAEREIKGGKHSTIGIPISIGNPHFVIFVSEFADHWQDEAADVQSHSGFAHGVNVEIVKVTDRQNLKVKFFERGAGVTRSSGTGSCAAAVAAIASKRADSPIRVHADGGTQSVRWEDQIFLRGKASIICRGEWFD